MILVSKNARIERFLVLNFCRRPALRYGHAREAKLNNRPYGRFFSLASLGLTKTDAVRGKRAKWGELYLWYSERHFAKFDDEMRQIFKELCDYKNRNAHVVRCFRMS